MLKKNFKFFLIFLFIAFILNCIFFYRLKDGQFLFIGDQFFRFSYFETSINSFFIRKIENLGIHNSWQLTIQFWDVLYYLLIYKLNFSLLSAEKILFFLVLFISLCLSFIGFQKISSVIDIKGGGINIFVITLWYCFNPYTMILWHGGVYSLGSALVYSLAPLIYYYFHKSIFSDFKLKNIIICSLLLFIASFTFWLFAVIVFFLVWYSFFYVLFNLFNKKFILNFLKNSLTLLLIYTPLISFIIFNLLYEYYNKTGYKNPFLNPAYGNQQGGIWYQLLLLFSWGIYTKWVPRSIYSFGDYYFSGQYIVATLLIYAIISFGVIIKYWESIFPKLIGNRKLLSRLFSNQKTKPEKIPLENSSRTFLNTSCEQPGLPKAKTQSFRQGLMLRRKVQDLFKKVKTILFRNVSLTLNYKDKLLIIFLLIFAISLFFAKAAQPPFGQIFVFFYEHLPFFPVFRSADHRFGFSVVLALSFLLLYVSKQYNKYFFFAAIFIVMLFQNLLFFNGTAIYGENKNNSFYDRIIYISRDHQEVIDFLNKDKQGSGYILSIPAVQYGHYIFDKDGKERHIGQDLLPKLIDRPFIYSSLSSGMRKQSYDEIDNILKGKNKEGGYELLRGFPIKYIILRKDMATIDWVEWSSSKKWLEDEFELLFENELFLIYRIEGYSPVVNSKNISFKVINPVKYRAQFNNVKDKQDLNLMLSFDKDWKLYIERYNNRFYCDKEKSFGYSNVMECIEEQRFFEGEELSYLRKEPIFDNTHRLVNEYANGWTIDPQYIKAYHSSEYYKENPDGSIDFELVIYFEPQSNFYLGSIISGMTLLCCITYLGCDWGIRKKGLWSKLHHLWKRRKSLGYRSRFHF